MTAAALEVGVRADSFAAGVSVGVAAALILLSLLGGLAIVRRIMGA